MRFYWLKCAIFTMAVFIGGCGFHLQHHSNALINTQSHTLAVDFNQIDKDFYTIFVDENKKLGQKTTTDNPTITAHNLSIRRFELLGLLSEVRLVATVQVHYKIGDKVHSHTLQSSRSHQYNKTNTAPNDPHYAEQKRQLYADLTQQMIWQYRTLVQSLD